MGRSCFVKKAYQDGQDWWSWYVEVELVNWAFFKASDFDFPGLNDVLVAVVDGSHQPLQPSQDPSATKHQLGHHQVTYESMDLVMCDLSGFGAFTIWFTSTFIPRANRITDMWRFQPPVCASLILLTLLRLLIWINYSYPEWCLLPWREHGASPELLPLTSLHSACGGSECRWARGEALMIRCQRWEVRGIEHCRKRPSLSCWSRNNLQVGQIFRYPR